MARRPGPSLDREQVVEAAIRLVEAEGGEALGVSRVARVLGIKPPSLYNHVGKGDALARAVVLEGNRRMLACLQQVPRAPTPRARVLALALAARGWARGNAGLYGVMLRVPPDNGDPALKPVYDALIGLFAAPLTDMGLGDDAVIHAVRGLRAAMQGFALLENEGQYALAVDARDSYRWLVEVILDGLERGADGQGVGERTM